jgi:hypothetical protein
MSAQEEATLFNIYVKGNISIYIYISLLAKQLYARLKASV